MRGFFSGGRDLNRMAGDVCEPKALPGALVQAAVGASGVPLSLCNATRFVSGSSDTRSDTRLLGRPDQNHIPGVVQTNGPVWGHVATVSLSRWSWSWEF